MAMEKLLCIGIPAPEQLERIATKLHLRTVSVPPTSMQQTIGTLAGYAAAAANLNQTPPAAEKLPPEGILVLCGLKNSHMDRLLQELRQAGYGDVYKAVLTPTNAAWQVLQLAQALVEERKAMQAQA